jgi:hypothetical protein
MEKGLASKYAFMTGLTDVNINEIYLRADSMLKASPQITFSFDRKWSDKFPSKAGVYAIFYNDQLFYIGESANLKERMKEIKRTVNHSFRRKLGKFIEPDALIVKGKFSPELELRLNQEYEKNISVSFVEVNFGRIEIENYLMQINQGVLNSIGNRARLK